MMILNFTHFDHAVYKLKTFRIATSVSSMLIMKCKITQGKHDKYRNKTKISVIFGFTIRF